MRKSVVIFICLLLLTTTLVASCAEPEDDTPNVSAPVTSEPVASDKVRITEPDISDTAKAELVQGNAAFAFDLYRELSTPDENLLFSPHSISQALAMTYAGARNRTETEMADVLHYTLPQTELHAGFNWLDRELMERGGDDFQLTVANAIWGQSGYPFLPEYLDILALQYGAGLQTLDFIDDGPNAGDIINEWVSDQTAGRITDIIKPATINADTRLILANAIYFKAKWLHQFEESATFKSAFTLLDGTTVSVPTMAMEHDFKYTEGEGFQVIELPYQGNELSMVILLPETGAFETFGNSMNSKMVEQIISDLTMTNIWLNMPKFEFESDLDLKKALQNMGMSSAFKFTADFSGMDGTQDLLIDEVKHKAFVLVDETGTEAAAATIVDVVLECARETTSMIIDRPFIFLIRDIGTGEILFLGNVINPEG